jgi:uncharacterized membrane protein YdfJ with MMPL/SSD domain
MPTHFFSIAWPLVIGMIILAGIVVSTAALTTMVAAITRARQITKGSQAQEGTDVVDQSSHSHRRSSQYAGFPVSQEPAVMETVTVDGIHFIPVP